MQGDRLKQAETIFAVLVNAPREERDALLAQHCGEDSELRAFVERLLDHRDTGGGGVLDPPVAPDAVVAASASDAADTVAALGAAGRTLGHYVLRERLGAGGMGEVWRAEQTTPIRRTVALKLIKAGMDSEQIVARFEAERQALALMDHPAIAKVLDAGTTPEGRPYFVMEHVPGIPITEYCDRRRLGTQERLELFQRVCEGVQHAHLKAVIHRDLKPSNILVADVDGKPQPRIIDFGVAKATTQRLTEQTMHTALGQLIGTPEYMSPEQADLTVEDVDTRTDVYSLGVVLYELLAGALPFDSARLRQAGFEGILRLLREEDPPRPSTKLSSLGERTAEIARSRRTEPRRLAGQLRGDLDWIVMRALEKDRNRRYGSPQELARDIERHLADEPVQAGPPDPVYRARKFVRRHRVALAFATLIFLAISGALVESNRQRAKVEAALETAETERARAVREAEKARQVSRFVQEMLGANNPGAVDYTGTSSKEREFARRLLDRAAENVETRLANQPEVLADIQDVLGTTYRPLGFTDAAKRHLEAALKLRRGLFGDWHLDVATSFQHLGETVWNLDYEEARPLFEQALAIRRDLLGLRHQDVAEPLFYLGLLEWHWSADNQVWSVRDRSAERAEQLLRQALEILTETGDVPTGGIASCKRFLAAIHRSRGEFRAAVTFASEGLAARRALLGDEHYLVTYDLEELANCLRAAGDPAAAEPLLRRVLAIRTALLDEHHYEHVAARRELGLCLWEQGKFAAADSFYLQALAPAREHWPAGDVALRELPDIIAWNRLSQGDRAAADSIIVDMVDRTRAVHGNQSLQLVKVLDQVAMTHLALGRFDEAVTAQRQALSIYRHLYGDEHKDVAFGMIVLAQALYSRGDPGRRDHEDAESLLGDAENVLRRLYGDEIPWFYQEWLWRVWGLTLVTQGRAEEAGPMLQRAVESSRGHARRHAWAKSAYGAYLSTLGRYDEAKAFHLESYEALRGLYRRRASFVVILHRLIDLYERIGDEARAREFERELHAIIAPPRREDRGS